MKHHQLDSSNILIIEDNARGPLNIVTEDNENSQRRRTTRAKVDEVRAACLAADNGRRSRFQSRGAQCSDSVVPPANERTRNWTPIRRSCGDGPFSPTYTTIQPLERNWSECREPTLSVPVRQVSQECISLEALALDTLEFSSRDLNSMDLDHEYENDHALPSSMTDTKSKAPSTNPHHSSMMRMRDLRDGRWARMNMNEVDRV